MQTTQIANVKSLAIKACAIAALTATSASAMAGFITYETRHTTSPINRADYQASWGVQEAAITTSDLSQFVNVRAPGSHRHSHLRVEFDLDALSAMKDWVFQFAVDAGHGGGLYLNGQLTDASATDLWWGYNWNRTDEILSAASSSLITGTNVIDLYWAEACCNGGQSGRFSVNGGQDWMNLSVANLDRMAVPEPSMLALLGVGVAGIGFARRKRIS